MTFERKFPLKLARALGLLRPDDTRGNTTAGAHYVRLDPSALTGPDPIVLSDTVLDDIAATVGSSPAEQGGMLGGARRVGAVTAFHCDGSARRSSATYSPDTQILNRLLSEEWNPTGIDLLGFVHSHPVGFWRPSAGDREYAATILDAIPAMDRLLLPIVATRPDTGSFSIHPHVATRSRRGVDIAETEIRIVTSPDSAPTLRYAGFDRVGQAYDLEVTYGTRLVIVGVGGAAGFAESMARAGVGEFVLIDPDTVETCNLGTQHVYPSDIGHPKVDVVGRRIVALNPHARVVGLQVPLDGLTDDMMRRLIHRPLPNTATTGPSTVVICGFTDQFGAQARVNRLALHFGIPMVAAQVYREGRGVEVTFAVPGVTPACGRCVLGSRYRAYLEGGFTNDVTSHGTPLWATEHLNSLKAAILLAIVHGTAPGDRGAHPARQRYGALLDQIAERNLVVGRLDPDIESTLGLTMFDKALSGADGSRLVMGDTLWLPQKPEHPSTGFARCGDCLGNGDLRTREGRLKTTLLDDARPPVVRRRGALHDSRA